MNHQDLPSNQTIIAALKSQLAVAKNLAVKFSDLSEELERKLAEAERTIAELRAEIDRLNKLIDETASHWLSLEPPVRWEGAIDAAMEAAVSEILDLRFERDEAKRVADGAYYERNRVVAALAKCFPSGVARTSIEGWSDDWQGCVYIDLPTGQASWHFHDSHAWLFDDLPPYVGTWDGHTTEEKYGRLRALRAAKGE